MTKLLGTFFFLPILRCLRSPASPGIEDYQKITVAQLEQALAASQGKPDAETAQELSRRELTERLNAAKLTRWQASLPGERARQSLLVLADQSDVPGSAEQSGGG